MVIEWVYHRQVRLKEAKDDLRKDGYQSCSVYLSLDKDIVFGDTILIKWEPLANVLKIKLLYRRQSNMFKSVELFFLSDTHLR